MGQQRPAFASKGRCSCPAASTPSGYSIHINPCLNSVGQWVPTIGLFCGFWFKLHTAEVLPAHSAKLLENSWPRFHKVATRGCVLYNFSQVGWLPESKRSLSLSL